MPTRVTRQINIRVSSDVYDVLETVRYLRDLRGMKELLEPVLASFAIDASVDANVQQALEARRASLAAASRRPSGVTPSAEE